VTPGAGGPAAGPPSVLVSVTEIRRRPGSRLPVHRSIEAVGLTLTDVGVPDGAEVSLDGELESIHDGVVLTAAATVPWVGACRRCLKEVEGVATIDLREVYEIHPVDGETWPLDHDHVDVGPLLHDTALLALPLAPLCGDDCAGPAPDSYPAVPDDEASSPPGEGDDPPRDPRWAALDDLDL
jgi:uncharacterized protein